jgi:hypothetical protein
LCSIESRIAQVAGASLEAPATLASRAGRDREIANLAPAHFCVTLGAILSAREPDASELRALPAVQVLELHRSEAARQLLRHWSEGTPGLRLTEASRAALAR